MRTPLVIGNWKMHGTLAEAARSPGPSATASSVRAASRSSCVRRSPRSPRWRRCWRLADPARRADCHHEPSGAHTGRDLAAHARRARLSLVAPGALRAAHGDRRDGRADQPQGARGPGPRAHAGALRGRDADERRQGLTFTTVEGQLRAGLAGLGAGARSPRPCWPTSRCGRSAPASTRRRPRPPRCTAISAASSPSSRRRRSRRPCASCTAAASSRRTPATLLAEPEVDGALVGGASLNAPGLHRHRRKAARIGTAAKE